MWILYVLTAFGAVLGAALVVFDQMLVLGQEVERTLDGGFAPEERGSCTLEDLELL